MSVFSSFWGNVVLLAFPGYLVYKYGPTVVSYCCARKSAPSNNEDEGRDDVSKRQAKKEKKGDRVKYAKH